MKCKIRKIQILAFLLIVIIGGSVRLYQVCKYPTWWDEHANVFTASGVLVENEDPISGSKIASQESKDSAVKIPIGRVVPVAEIIDKCRWKNILEASIYWDLGNGVSFTILLHFWLQAFGYSDAAIRGLSLVFGILLIPAGFAVAKKITDNVWVALVASGLIACNALLIEYSREARSYSLAVLLSLLGTYVFLKVLEDKKNNPIQMLTYAMLMTALCFSHYLAVPVLIIAHLCGAVFSSNRKNAFICWLTGVCSMSVVFGSWILYGASRGLTGMKRMDAYWLQNAISGTYPYVTVFHWKEAIQMLVERSVWFNCPLLIFWPPQGTIYGVLLIIFISTVLFGLLEFRRLKGPDISPLLLCVVLSTGMIYSMILSFKSGHTLPFINRYNIFYIPYQQIIIATGVVGIFKLKSGVLRYTLLFIVAIGLSKIVYSNLKYALNAKPKETFSFDRIIEECNVQKTHLLRCQDQDSAIIASLKIKKINKNNAFVIIDKSCKFKSIPDDHQYLINSK